MEQSTGRDVLFYERDAKRLLKKGHRENHKVYIEVRAYLQQYASFLGVASPQVFVPYWVHSLTPPILARMLMSWCEHIEGLRKGR